MARRRDTGVDRNEPGPLERARVWLWFVLRFDGDLLGCEDIDALRSKLGAMSKRELLRLVDRLQSEHGHSCAGFLDATRRELGAVSG